MQDNFPILQETIGYRFRDPSLLKLAMIHSSYANEHRLMRGKDNERLEFLGDAVLELSSSEFIYQQYPDMPEGDMTRLRASLVCEPTLAMCARMINLQQYLLLGRGEELTGGRDRNSIVSDALEALIGAIYLDGGFANAKEFVFRFIMNDIEHKKLFYDSKTILQEIVQREWRDKDVRYELTGESGPDHAKIFTVDLCIDNTVWGSGKGSTKKAAEQEAAYRALLALKNENIRVTAQ
ncbi:MAG: ribonuclease III [Lachnospiraceae bacterium]|nr:ribonuclease III [Lachnospiraceae bacterium]